VGSPVERLRKLVGNRRAWRWTVAAVIVLPILFVVPHARSLVVRNAVTTAYLFSMKTPISGHIREVAAEAGAVTADGMTLVSIHNDKVDGSRVARLEVLQDRAQEEVEQLQLQLQALRNLADTRNREYLSNVSSAEQDLVSQLQIVTDRTQASASALTEAQGNRERIRRLYESELLSISDVEAAEAAYERALADRSANELERIRLTGRLEEIDQGVFQVDIPEGVLLTRQAAQDLDVELMRLQLETQRSEANLQATIAETTAARAAFDRQAAADLRLPAGKKVWEVHATPGTWATEGGTLLTFVDCERLMVDIAVDDATLELIEPGSDVRVRLFGSFAYRPAKVMLVRGSAALNSDSSALAAEVENRGARKGRVLARLEPSDLSEKPPASCGIGRTAYAEFEDLNLFELLILPIFR